MSDRSAVQNHKPRFKSDTKQADRKTQKKLLQRRLTILLGESTGKCSMMIKLYF